MTVPFDLSSIFFVITFDLPTKSKKSSKKIKSLQFTFFTLFFSLWNVFLSVCSLCFSRNSLISFPVDFSFRALCCFWKFAQLSE